MAEHECLVFRGREEWRSWLELSHGEKNSVWVTIRKVSSQGPGLSYDEAVEEATCFGWVDGVMRSIDDQSFALRFSPRRKNSPWALSNRERAARLIAEGRMAPAGIRAVDEAKRSGRWDSAYTSRVAPEVPGDLEEALKADPEAWRNFEAFSNSVKLMYVYWVEEAKRDETRARRIAEVVSRAARNVKPT